MNVWIDRIQEIEREMTWNLLKKVAVNDRNELVSKQALKTEKDAQSAMHFAGGGVFFCDIVYSKG